jgi:hypothetical protein
MDLPDDVFNFILQYLPFHDVLSIQQTCTHWWEVAKLQKSINIVPKENGYKKPFKLTREQIEVFGRRFPNITEIYCSQHLSIRKVQEELSAFKYLQLASYENAVWTIKCVEWDTISQIWPLYRGLELTAMHDITNTKIQIPANIASMNITHVSLLYSSYNEEFLQRVLPYVTRTVTHVHLSSSAPLPALKKLIEMLPSESNITHFTCKKVIDANLWTELFSKSPKLIHYQGSLSSVELAASLDAYCPKLTSLQLDDMFGSKVNEPNSWFRNLKKLKLFEDIMQLDDDIQLEEFSSDDWEDHYLPHLKNVKILNVKVFDIKKVIDNFPTIQEVWISTNMKLDHIKQLANGIPKLRFIHGSNDRIRQGKDGRGEVIDANEIRLISRPTKKAKR